MNVEELIQKKKIMYRQQGADFVVHCLNPEHDDSNPSMRIDKITGIFHCFSCGYKGSIFKYFDTPVSFLEQKRARLKSKIEDRRTESVGLTMPKDLSNLICTMVPPVKSIERNGPPFIIKDIIPEIIRTTEINPVNFCLLIKLILV